MPVRPPRQARSEASLGRMVQAAEEVLREKGFDEVTLAEIAARAGVTVGAFYGRFRGKDALLVHLEERVLGELRGLVGGQADRLADRAGPLASLVFDLLMAATAFYRAHRGTLRALDLRARSDPALRARLDAANRATLQRLAPIVEARRDEIRHPGPSQAFPFAVLLAGNTLREAVLFDTPWLAEAGWSDRKLARELTRAFLAYLGVDQTAPPPD
ncbi:MAG TPA: helix-turn-helix domain-containing protein [Longimicrobium sp.]|nr:helix-turn-helix domain-containing protein [Longimicrobium sp.]